MHQDLLCTCTTTCCAAALGCCIVLLQSAGAGRPSGPCSRLLTLKSACFLGLCCPQCAVWCSYAIKKKDEIERVAKANR